MADHPGSVLDIIDCLGSLASEREDVTVDDVVKSFGGRSYGPMILVPALVGISPVGGVPGVPSFFAALIAVIAVQILIGRSHFWLPSVLAQRSVSGEKLGKASDKLEGPAKKLDAVFGDRINWATEPPAPQIAAAVILVLCGTIPLLEIVPFAAAVPFGAIAAFGVALMVRDGALMLLAIAVSLASLGIAVTRFLF
ncbi:MAG: exopolysaccharide biosynthesis protein [Erythrobacter sp.]